MSIESAVYISDLNASFPPDADPIGQADDHLRLLKSVLKATFPSLTGPVTSTQVQLNSPYPIGGVCFWYGAIATVPTGWALCDGRTVARSDGTGNITTPNLTDSFIRCAAGGTVTPGLTGGAATHTHNITINGTALTTAQLPAHTHTVTDTGHAHGVTDLGHSHGITTFPGYTGFLTGSVNVNTYALSTAATNPLTTTTVNSGVSVNSATTGISLANTGSGSTHTHTASEDAQSIIPPFVGLVPIMKV